MTRHPPRKQSAKDEKRLRNSLQPALCEQDGLIVCTATLQMLGTLRIFTLPMDTTLDELHRALCANFGFSAQAGHEFCERAGQQRHHYGDYADPTTDRTRVFNERQYTLHRLCARLDEPARRRLQEQTGQRSGGVAWQSGDTSASLQYLYDFTACWEIELRLDHFALSHTEAWRCLKASGLPPLERCSSPGHQLTLVRQAAQGQRQAQDTLHDAGYDLHFSPTPQTITRHWQERLNH